jgi:F-type H+-transporting ATPase subunit epsilon
MSLNIILYTPNKTMCNTVSEEIFLPTPDGEICIQPRHQQLVSALSIGLLRFKEGSTWNLFVVMGGIVEIKSDNVHIYSIKAEQVNLVELNDIQERLTKAEEQLKNAKNDQEKVDALQNLQRISALLKATSYME